jgi:hypothetical protein
MLSGRVGLCSWRHSSSSHSTLNPQEPSDRGKLNLGSDGTAVHVHIWRTSSCPVIRTLLNHHAHSLTAQRRYQNVHIPSKIKRMILPQSNKNRAEPVSDCRE